MSTPDKWRWPVWLFFLIAGLQTQGASYYVDAARGDDRRDGLTSESAWRSLDKVNRAELAPGDRVLFRRGQSWRGQLVPHSGTAGALISYGAFGDGAKPVFLGSAAADREADWVRVGQGIWATAPVTYETIKVEKETGQGGWWLHQEAGAACNLTTERNGEGGRFTLHLNTREPGTKANHIQLSFPGISLVEGEYYLLKFRARASKAFRPASASVMKGGAPWTSYAGTEGPRATIGTNWAEHTLRFRASQSAQDARLTIFLGGVMEKETTLLLQPAQLVNVRCSQPVALTVDVGNVIFNHGKKTGVKKWREEDLREELDYYYDGATAQVKLCLKENPATRYRSIELALSKHIINQGGRSYVTYQDLDLRYGAAHGIGGGGTRGISVRNCDISFIGGGHQSTRPDGKPVRYGNGVEFWSGASDCVVEGCRIWEIYDAALTNQGDGTNVQENIIYRRNVIWNSEYSFEYWNRGPASQTRNIIFEHNTCVDAGYGWGHGQRPDRNGRHLMFYDNSAATTNVVIRYNIFSEATDSCMRLHGRDWTGALRMNFNCWHQRQGPLVLWGTERVGREEFGGFMGAHGLESHSVVADPNFEGRAGGDYRLRAGSPARALKSESGPAGALP